MTATDALARTETLYEPERALVQQFRLVVTEGADRGREHASTAERVVVGAAEGADLVLADPTVSRFHCEVAVAGDRFVVKDLASRNGTRVDGVAVTVAPLRDGATLTVGRTKLRFEIGEGRVEVPLSSDERFGGLVGRSPAMRAVFSALARAAAHDTTVLLRGETGTGKEVAAESVHAASDRRDRPLLVIDCAALPPQLIESELFGHEKGAFSGADERRVGAFEDADGGTVLLDEIGELPLDLQPRLLRVLEQKEIRRVGGNRYRSVDVRVIAATHRDLRGEVNDGRFRADLFYRLAVVEIVLPPLRTRPEDLPATVESLLEALDARDRPEAASLTTRAFLETLERHAWPGNVRELKNYLEKCLVLSEPAPLDARRAAASLELPIDPRRPIKEARQDFVRAFERRYLEELLAACGGNVTAAARQAGVDRIHFYRLLWRHGLR